MSEKDINKERQELFNTLIKEKLENYNLPPDDAVWEDIEANINDKPKRIVLWPWISGAAIAASIILLWLIFPFDKEINSYESAKFLSENEKTVTETVLPEEMADHLPDRTVPSERLFDVETSEERTQNRLSNTNSDSVEHEIKTTSLLSEKEKLYAETETKESLQVKEPEELLVVENKSMPQAEKQEKALTQEDYSKLLMASASSHEEIVIRKTKNKRHQNSLSLALASGNDYIALNDPANVSPTDPFYNGLRATQKPLLASGTKASKDLIENMFVYDDFSEVSHSAPLSFGLSFRLGLNNRFSLETGLYYSYVTSYFENNEENFKKDATLSVHYLGIPLSLVADIYSTHKWSFYLSAGMAVEKGLLCNYTENDYTLKSEGVMTRKTNQKVEGVQLSANISPGVEFKFNRNYSVYLEPKVNYYFDNNQPISVYTERPLNIGAKAGLRFTF